MELYMPIAALLLAAAAVLIAGRVAARWVEHSSAEASARHAEAVAAVRDLNAADWVPTSERLPNPGRGCVPFVSKSRAGDEHWGFHFNAEDLDLKGGDGAWYCETCGSWIAGAEVTYWYDLPAPPAPEGEREGSELEPRQGEPRKGTL